MKDSISRETMMDILDQFERRAIEAIKTDKQIKTDNYESVGRHKLIEKIRKAMAMAFRKEWPKSIYSLDDILRPGKLF